MAAQLGSRRKPVDENRSTAITLGGHVPGDCLIYSVDRHEKSIQLPSNIVSLRHRETLGALLDMRRTKFGRAWTSKKSFPNRQVVDWMKQSFRRRELAGLNKSRSVSQTVGHLSQCCLINVLGFARPKKQARDAFQVYMRRR